MRNAIISCLIFILVLGFVGYSNNELKSLCSEIESKCMDIEFLILSGNWEDAFTKTSDILNLMTEKENISAIYVNHTDFDHLADEAIKLSVFTQTRTLDEALASVHHLKYGAINLRKVQDLAIENIF